MNLGHYHLPVLVDDLEFDLVADLNFVQHGLFLDLKNHGHGRHLEVPDLAVLDCQLACILVDLADLAVGHVFGHVHLAVVDRRGLSKGADIRPGRCRGASQAGSCSADRTGHSDACA